MGSYDTYGGGHSPTHYRQRSVSRSHSVVDRGRYSAYCDHSRTSNYRPSRRFEYRDDRRSSRSRSLGGGVKDLVATGIMAVRGKDIYDRPRSRSRGRENHSRSGSGDGGGPRRHRSGNKGSHSISEYLREGLTAVGLGNQSDSRHGERSPRYDSSSEDEYSGGYHSHRRGRRPRDGHSAYSREVVGTRSTPDKNTTRSLSQPHPGAAVHSSSSESDSDLGSSTDEEGTRKELRKGALWATGFATLATVHTFHSISNKMKRHKTDDRKLRKGKISPEEVDKERVKHYLHDAASIGLSAFAIKGAISEWQEAANSVRETRSFHHKSKQRAKQRAERRARSHSVDSPRF